MRRMTFLRWLTEFAALLEIPRRAVCLDQAWWEYCQRRSPGETFDEWAAMPRPRF